MAADAPVESAPVQEPTVSASDISLIAKEQNGELSLLSTLPTPSRGGRPRPDAAARGRDRGASSALEDLMRRRGVDEAWNALEEMQAKGTTTDKYTVSRMLNKTVSDQRARMNSGRAYRAISLVEKFIDMQPQDVDEVLFNAVLDTCGRLKDLSRLETTVQRMRDLKVTPSPVTLGILVKTYGQAGQIDKVLCVWEEMEKQREQANAVTYGCMIDACVKCGRLQTAIEIFNGMRETGKHRNTILYTTLIKGYGLEKDLKSALELFREMLREGVPYNTITYNSIIDACVKGGDLATAEALLHEIIDPRSPNQPDLITFSTLLKGYCHSGDLDKALQLAEAIKAHGLHADELVYNTLMDGCVKANDVTAGIGLFEEMVHAGMRPSTITSSILVRLYQRAGYEDDAMQVVEQLYQHHGIERPSFNDRSRGAGRRRSPNASPHGSPFRGGYGGSWSDSHSMCSNASTPMGSPHASHQTGMFLPLDATASMPPLPALDGSGTPHSSCHGGTPVAGSPMAYAGAMAFPDQAQMMGMTQMQHQSIPSVPAWPFAQQAPDPVMGQFFPQPAAPTPQQQMPPQGWASPMGGAPLSFGPPGQAPGQGVFFQNFTPTNQGSIPMNSGQNPFCM